MAHDAFISYSSHDKAVADAACALLESRGIRCWIAPRDVTPGMDWGSEIIDAINGARVMVLVYSASANESGQIRREVERGVHKGIPIVPFRIEDVPMSKSLEYFISAQHWLDAMTPPLEQHLDYLARTVTLLLSRPGPPSETSDDTPEMDTDAAPTPLHDPPFASANAGIGAGAGAAAAGAASATPTSTSSAGAPASAAPAFASPAAPAFTPSAAPAPPRSGQSGLSAGARRKASAAGLLVLFLAIAAWAVMGKSSKVDSAIVGHWNITKDDQSGHWVSDLTFEKEGTYHLHVTLLETGTMTGSPGHFHLVSTAHTITDGTYILLDPTTLQTTTTSGTVRWTRQASSVDPNHTTDLTGIWDASPIVNGSLVHQEIDSRADGTYHLTSTTDDAGTFSTEHNRWRTQSSTGRILEGSYTIPDPHTLSWVGPLGTTVFSRE